MNFFTRNKGKIYPRDNGDIFLSCLHKNPQKEKNKNIVDKLFFLCTGKNPLKIGQNQAFNI